MLSIIIPFHNEKENVRALFNELSDALKGISHEIIFVDDGSTDSSSDEIKNLDCILISHRRKKGKGAALISGLEKARGDRIAFMDADLQDDPTDLSKFIEKLDDGYDMVTGWRKNRKDRMIMNLISKIGNTLVWRTLLNSPFHDINCGYKMFKKEVLETLPLYGDNFRFLALSAYNEGFKVGEVIVNHRARAHGVSKYTPVKALFGLLDTIATYFIFRFSEKPMHFFGFVGGLFFSSGFIVALYLSYERIFHGILLYRRPALLFAILLIIVGIQIIMTGIVAELIVYIHKKRLIEINRD